MPGRGSGPKIYERRHQGSHANDYKRGMSSSECVAVVTLKENNLGHQSGTEPMESTGVGRGSRDEGSN